MRNKIVTTAAVIAGLFSLFSACSKKNDAGGTTLRWQTLGSAQADPINRRTARQFEKKHPGIKITMESVPPGAGYTQKLFVKFTAGDNNAPDVFWNSDMVTFATKDTLLDLSAFRQKDPECFERLNPALLNGVILDNKIWSLPVNCGVALLFYNKEMFDAAGVAYPGNNLTWDDLLTLAKRMTIKEGNMTRQYGLILTSHVYRDMVLGIQESFYSPDYTRALFDTPAMIKSVRKAMTFLYSGACGSMSELAENSSGWGAELFLGGRAAMYIGLSFEIGTINQQKDQLRLSVARIPKFPEGTHRPMLHFSIVSVYKGTKTPDEAWAFVKYLGSDEAIIREITRGGSLPVTLSGNQFKALEKATWIDDNGKTTLIESLRTGISTRQVLQNNPWMPSTKQAVIFSEEMDPVFFNNTPEWIPVKLRKVQQRIQMEINEGRGGK